MSTTIRILPEQLCNKIAAGEVVERPAAAVKELVENALDASATEVLIEVEAGGKRLIRVTDDGLGMSRDDLLLCLERHATSKIADDEDLFRLHTFGFRGEALPSIAAVCRLTLRSRAAAADEGWELYAEGGVVRRTAAVGTAVGTSVEVRDLFFNTPARRKFLRQEETELGHIGDVVTRLALAQPEVRFSLLNRGRPLLEVYRHGSLEERVAALLGRHLLRELQPLSAEGAGNMRLRGLVGMPGTGRATSGSIYTFINGRYIRDRVVQHALLEGYRHLLLKGRYPVAVLFLEIDPAQVDVNVHPTKHEVRFREQSLVHDFIATSVRDALREPSRLPSAASMNRTVELPPAQSADIDHQANPSFARQLSVQESLEAYGPRCDPARDSIRTAPVQAPEPSASIFAEPVSPRPFSAMTVIGQYRRSYIVCQDGDDLVLIDQHAAHERIGFERLKAEFDSGRIERQVLLFPPVLEFDFKEAAMLQERLPDLDRLGFELEPFGGRSYVLKGVPRLLGENECESLLRDVAAELSSLGSSGRIEEALESLLVTMACHGMIRANRPLAPLEIAALLRDLDGVDFSSHCPHGRPVVKRFALGEVERMFRRS